MGHMHVGHIWAPEVEAWGPQTRRQCAARGGAWLGLAAS
jgi:hypothetical protein